MHMLYWYQHNLVQELWKFFIFHAMFECRMNCEINQLGKFCCSNKQIQTCTTDCVRSIKFDLYSSWRKLKVLATFQAHGEWRFNTQNRLHNYHYNVTISYIFFQIIYSDFYYHDLFPYGLHKLCSLSVEMINASELSAVLQWIHTRLFCNSCEELQ